MSKLSQVLCKQVNKSSLLLVHIKWVIFLFNFKYVICVEMVWDYYENIKAGCKIIDFGNIPNIITVLAKGQGTRGVRILGGTLPIIKLDMNYFKYLFAKQKPFSKWSTKSCEIFLCFKILIHKKSFRHWTMTCENFKCPVLDYTPSICKPNNRNDPHKQYGFLCIT